MQSKQDQAVSIWKYFLKWILIFSGIAVSLLVALVILQVIGEVWVNRYSSRFCDGISIGDKVENAIVRGKQANMRALVSTHEKTQGSSFLSDPTEVPFSNGTLDIHYSVGIAIYMCTCTLSFQEKKITEKSIYCLM